ncbi:ABC transporter ATP-binding protein [Exiguobacterium aestuarii]|uniref:ABC transporter ATP-binding protein n=1 Tax=Exiguobacterium aestuarii TaxID=273527 RepID=A0ABW2PKP7_9BACL|nr:MULTISPECIES: ABC transporter ATP-binding protein [Exiguobacterium]MCT4786711.1 ABC transporter ATP-binding protein [Exiguobacterium aestuarii]
MEYVIEMLNIRKEFGTFVANDNITLQLRKGEIHALLGENGAGKSTLMNVLFGLYQPEGGEIRVHGKKVDIENPNIANELGIGMVHQHFMLVEKFTVTENIILGLEPKSGVTIDRATARKKVKDISEQYGLKIDPDAKIEDISVGMQQRVEILKTLYRGADILIFDEPTAVLTPQEIQELIQIMKRLIAEGKSIILITHKLKEIMQVADRCTVIRRGRYIGTVEVDETVNEDSLAEMMVGREVNFDAEYSKADPQQVVLDVQGLVVKDSRGLKVVEGLDLQIRAGEVLGIAGIDGNGQTELIEAISGLKKPESGKVLLNGKDVTGHTPRKMTEAGIGHIPQDRHKHGLVLDYSIRDNMVLQTYYKEPFSKRGLMNYKAVAEKAKALIEKFDVRTPSIDVPARALSGGNQQKAIIAREVDRSPDLLIAAQPTRGLDVGAIEFIHEQLVKEREKGRAVLLISFELDEILHVSDRIAVLYEGKIVGIRDPKETTEQELGFLMAGGQRGDDTE